MMEELGGLELEIARNLGAYIKGDGASHPDQMIDCIKAWARVDQTLTIECRGGRRWELFDQTSGLTLVFRTRGDAELARRQMIIHAVLAASRHNHPCPYMRHGDCGDR